MTVYRIEVLHTDERTLEVMAAHGSGKLTLDQIGERLKLHRNTIHRSVKRLVDAGYVTRSGRGRQGSSYRIINARD